MSQNMCLRDYVYSVQREARDIRRRGVVADHAVAESRARPLGKPSALLVAVDKSFRHLRVNFGTEEVQEREERRDRIDVLARDLGKV